MVNKLSGIMSLMNNSKFGRQSSNTCGFSVKSLYRNRTSRIGECENGKPSYLHRGHPKSLVQESLEQNHERLEGKYW